MSKPAPYTCPVHECDCGCETITLVMDDQPQFEDEPHFRRCYIPTMAIVTRAMEIANAVADAAKEDRRPTQDHLLIAALFDAYMAQSELLARIAVYACDGTGDLDGDDRQLQHTFDCIHDLVRMSFRTGAEPEGTPTSVLLDLGNIHADMEARVEEEAINGFTLAAPGAAVGEA